MGYNRTYRNVCDMKKKMHFLDQVFRIYLLLKYVFNLSIFFINLFRISKNSILTIQNGSITSVVLIQFNFKKFWTMTL